MIHRISRIARRVAAPAIVVLALTVAGPAPARAAEQFGLDCFGRPIDWLTVIFASKAGTPSGTGYEVHGTLGNDVIIGSDGDDDIYGEHGNDVVCAGDGDDYINVTDLNYDIEEQVDGEDGDDTIYSGGGADILFGGKGNDIIHAGGGDDVLHGQIGADTLFGDSGADTIHCGDVGDNGPNRWWGTGDYAQPGGDYGDLPADADCETV
jgi:hypothetical protein